MEHNTIRTEVGTFEDNYLTTIEGEIIHCLTYGSLFEKVNKQFGAYNLRWSEDIDRWILFQYTLLDNDLKEVSQI